MKRIITIFRWNLDGSLHCIQYAKYTFQTDSNFQEALEVEEEEEISV
ncbi:hypothetical protein [Nostoc sp.]